MLDDQWAFLKATRFWISVMAALVLYGKLKGWIGTDETVLIETILGSFVTVRTVDRFSEFIGGARSLETPAETPVEPPAEPPANPPDNPPDDPPAEPPLDAPVETPVFITGEPPLESTLSEN